MGQELGFGFGGLGEGENGEKGLGFRAWGFRSLSSGIRLQDLGWKVLSRFGDLEVYDPELRDA